MDNIEERYCIWKEDEFSGEWATKCGNMWLLIEGNPEDNGMKFCPYCGKKLLQVIQERDEFEED